GGVYGSFCRIQWPRRRFLRWQPLQRRFSRLFRHALRSRIFPRRFFPRSPYQLLARNFSTRRISSPQSDPSAVLHLRLPQQLQRFQLWLAWVEQLVSLVGIGLLRSVVVVE